MLQAAERWVLRFSTPALPPTDAAALQRTFDHALRWLDADALGALALHPLFATQCATAEQARAWNMAACNAIRKPVGGLETRPETPTFVEVLKALLEHGRLDARWLLPQRLLWQSIETEDVFLRGLDLLANTQLDVFDRDEFGFSLVGRACQRFTSSALLALLRHPSSKRADMNQRLCYDACQRGTSLFGYACKRGYVAVVHELLSFPATLVDVNQLDAQFHTGLLEAACHCQRGVLELLLTEPHVARIDWAVADGEGRSAFGLFVNNTPFRDLSARESTIAARLRQRCDQARPRWSRALGQCLVKGAASARPKTKRNPKPKPRI